MTDITEADWLEGRDNWRERYGREEVTDAITRWRPPKPLEHIESSREDALRGNTFGILDSVAPVEEKLGRLVQLIPVALEIVDEARETISRLRAENERLRRGLER